MNELLLEQTKTRLVQVFKKQFIDFYGLYKQQKEADKLLEDIDEIIDKLETEMITFIEADEISMESCLDMMSSTFIMMILLTLESERESISNG